MKIAICWIGIGIYNNLFSDFYDSFNKKFCTECDRTFFIFTDLPEKYNSINNCIVYSISNACLHKGFILFRKFKFLLMAEDLYLNYDYVIYCNGNCVCNRNIKFSDFKMLLNKIMAVSHPLKKDHGYSESDICSNPFSKAYLTKKQWPIYLQSGFFIANNKEFLKMCMQIETWRMMDKIYKCDNNIPWHDETYYNKYCSKNISNIIIKDGKLFLCPEYLSNIDTYIYTLDKKLYFENNTINGFIGKYIDYKLDLYTL